MVVNVRLKFAPIDRPPCTLCGPPNIVKNETVSVVLSVRNAQHWIRVEIERLLDGLFDLTERFEIIVVDGASTDYTFEILEELSCRYPQVKMRRGDASISLDKALQLGMKFAQGDLIFTNLSANRFAVEDLRKLWALRGDSRLMVARSRTTARRIDDSIVLKLNHWAQRVTSKTALATGLVEALGGLQMVRREALDQLDNRGQSQIEVAHISHQHLSSPKLAGKLRWLPSNV